MTLLRKFTAYGKINALVRRGKGLYFFNIYKILYHVLENIQADNNVERSTFYPPVYDAIFFRMMQSKKNSSCFENYTKQDILYFLINFIEI